MTAKERPDVAKAYLDRIRDLVGGKRAMPSVQYEEDRGNNIHLSDVQRGLCLAKPVLRRTLPFKPEISDESALRFLKGRVAERTVASEMDPIVYENITMTLDDLHEKFGYAEIKSTDSSLGKFDPLNIYEHWKSRLLGYSKALGINKINLVVLFNRGDYKGIRVALRAWELTFTQDEIEENWRVVKERYAALMTALQYEGKVPMPMQYVTPNKWECGDNCGLAPYCQYKDGERVFDEKGE
jgi:hypothetical protein